MKAISIRQPWASLEVLGIKVIENRTWPCPKKYIGKRVLVHASMRSLSLNELVLYLTPEMSEALKIKGINGKELLYYPTGTIIGSVEIADCVFNHESIWAEKSDLKIDDNKICHPKPIYNWVLANPIKFETPIKAKGRLSFWEAGIEVCHICGQPTEHDFKCERCGEIYCEEHKAFTQNYKCCSLCEYQETV